MYYELFGKWTKRLLSEAFPVSNGMNKRKKHARRKHRKKAGKKVSIRHR